MRQRPYIEVINLIAKLEHLKPTPKINAILDVLDNDLPEKEILDTYTTITTQNAAISARKWLYQEITEAELQF